MAENENIVLEEQPEVPAEPKKRGAFKEWLRKKTVALKRAPHMIPLVCFLITTVYFMLVLYPLSQATFAAANDSHTKATGICVFITTLLSLLILVSFLNAFPKRKKPNIAFIVLVYLMAAGMVACDVVYYVQMSNCLDNLSSTTSTMYLTVSGAQPYMIVHVVLLGLSAVVFALLPLYAKLIRKIDTSVVLESATENMQGEIDIHED